MGDSNFSKAHPLCLPCLNLHRPHWSWPLSWGTTGHPAGHPILAGPTYRHHQSQKNGLGTARRTLNCQDAWSLLRCHKWLAPRVDHSESAQSWLLGECPKLTRKAISHGPSNSCVGGFLQCDAPEVGPQIHICRHRQIYYKPIRTAILTAYSL